MKLTKKALRRLSIPETRLKLALALKCTERWIELSIKKNKENGPLTTYSALQVIKQETGFDDSQILEQSLKKVA